MQACLFADQTHTKPKPTYLKPKPQPNPTRANRRESPQMLSKSKTLSRVLFSTASFGSIHGARSNPRSASRSQPSSSLFAIGGGGGGGGGLASSSEASSSVATGGAAGWLS